MVAEITLLESTKTKTLPIVIKKEKLFTANLIFILIQYLNDYLLHTNDKFITAHNKCLKIPPST
jgi:hypothetical protein